jgi:hypothetical protein
MHQQLTTEEILRSLGAQGFWGGLEIRFEAGKIVLLKKTETIKPASESKIERNNRRMNVSHSE